MRDVAAGAMAVADSKAVRCGIRLILLSAAVFIVRPAMLEAQQSRLRAVIGTEVACRAAPDTSAAVAVRYTVGDLFLPAETRQASGMLWYRDATRVSSSGCWIAGALTTEWADRDAALLTIADHILARTDPVPLVDYVAVNNLLTETPQTAHSTTTVLDQSPLLQLRRLQVLDAAGGAPDAWGRAVRRDPLKLAWFIAHDHLLQYHEPARRWVMRAEVYWTHFTRYQSTPWAEEIAWAAAQGATPGDECDGPCVISDLIRTYARYLQLYPDGRWADEAMDRAIDRATAGARYGCRSSAGRDIDRPMAIIRQRLADVTRPGRDSLLTLVDRIEESCMEEAGGR